MKEFIKDFLLPAMAVISLFIFFISIPVGMMAMKFKGCKYTTVLSRINLGYVIGCELARPRFEPYQ
jgi:uncharacterized membrane protein YobD (UPF0266 family)